MQMTDSLPPSRPFSLEQERMSTAATFPDGKANYFTTIYAT
jgi:hypothetical protein